MCTILSSQKEWGVQGEQMLVSNKGARKNEDI